MIQGNIDMYKKFFLPTLKTNFLHKDETKWNKNQKHVIYHWKMKGCYLSTVATFPYTVLLSSFFYTFLFVSHTGKVIIIQLKQISFLFK